MAKEPACDPVRILTADDHPVFRYGLRRLLESEPGFLVVGEASDGVQALRLARELSPHVVILDLALPQRPGLEVLRELAALTSPPRTIILTVAIEKRQIAQALQLGARGIVLKEAATELIIESVRTVLKGQHWVGRETVSDLVRLLQGLLPRTNSGPRPANFGLSRRELEVVAAVTAGYTNKDIAQKLAISEQTVKHHITSILDRLGLSNRMEIALFAISHQLVDDV
jgi:two-component system, NarL family, nitrate/nitrite response regulator NarL